MFTTLKKKIKEETGNDVTATPLYTSTSRRHSSQRSSLTGNGSGSFCSNGVGAADFRDPIDGDALIGVQLNELTSKYELLLTDYEQMMADKDRLEKTNEILEEALKVAQVQKELIYNEQDKIQNIQLEEISKLKSLLHFREQEAVDRLASIKQKDSQLENLQNENARLRELEATFEDVQSRYSSVSHQPSSIFDAFIIILSITYYLPLILLILRSGLNGAGKQNDKAANALCDARGKQSAKNGFCTCQSSSVIRSSHVTDNINNENRNNVGMRVLPSAISASKINSI